jgi:hypothetical protein
MSPDFRHRNICELERQEARGHEICVIDHRHGHIGFILDEQNCSRDGGVDDFNGHDLRG